MHKTVFKDGFSKLTGSFCHSHVCHKLALHVGREARIRQGFDINRTNFFRTVNSHSVSHFIHLNCRTAFYDFVQHRTQMVGNTVGYTNGTSGNSAGKEIAPSFNAVRNDGMVRPMQMLNTGNTNHSGTCTTYIGPHRIEEVCQVNNFRFFRCVFNHRHTFCKACCHHQVFGCPNTRHAQEDTIAL